MKQHLDARWLRDMAEEVAKAPRQELNWDRIEQGVFERLDAHGPRLLPRPSVAAWPRVLGAAAIAAVAAGLVLTASRTPGPGNPLEPTFVALQPDDVSQGKVEARTELVADDHPVTFEHAGWARFRLSPPGRLRVLRMDDRVALHLLEGKVEADVTRQNIDEAVTVRAGNLRVSVHGTLFSVELRDGTLRVQVERGSVAVGPASRGVTEGWLVTGPSTGVFDLARSRRLHGFASVSDPISLVPPPSPSTQAPSLPKVEVGAEPAPDAKAPTHSPAPVDPPAPISSSLPEALPEVLTADLAAATLESIAQGVTACHRNAVPNTDGVTIRVQTRISIRVAPDGHVAFARFDPPLSPRAQTCASGVVQGATFPRARVESLLELPLRL